MKATTNRAVLLCEYCHQPFSTEPLTAPETGPPPSAFTLCPACQRHGRALVAVTCADCEKIFPRQRWVVKLRRRWCKRAFCAACHVLRMAPKTVRVTCSSCGRRYIRTRKAEYDSQYRDHQRRICPICQPTKMVMVTCSRCRKRFSRQLTQVRAKQRMGYRNAVCRRCQRKAQQRKPQKGERA